MKISEVTIDQFKADIDKNDDIAIIDPFEAEMVLEALKNDRGDEEYDARSIFDSVSASDVWQCGGCESLFISRENVSSDERYEGWCEECAYEDAHTMKELPSWY